MLYKQSPFIDIKRIRQKFDLVGKSLIKSIVWIGWTTIFGLTPLLLVKLIRKFLITHEGISDLFSSAQILEEGIIMYFCVSILGALAIDCLHSEYGKRRYLNFFNLALSLLSLLVVSLLFLLHFANPKLEMNLNVLNTVQITLLFGTGLFCLLLKTAMYKLESKQ